MDDSKPVFATGFAVMERKIISDANPVFRNALRLTKRKYRDRTGRYLIEGDHTVREAFGTGQETEGIFLREGVNRGDFDFFPENLPPLYILSGNLFERLSGTENSRGIIAVVRKPDSGSERLVSVDRPGGNLLVTDRIQDPGNLGTIVRTAAASGYEAVVILPGTADVFSQKTVRAASGSLFRIPVIFPGDKYEFLTLAGKLGKRIAVTVVEGGVPYYEAGLSEDTALIIGNEGGGCDPDLIECSDIRVTVPMEAGVESLNASVAAGILMYETVRNLR